jgi:hypothetical protein
MEGNEAFRKLVWFMSGIMMDDPKRYSSAIEAFKRNNDELSKEQVAIIDEMIWFNQREG